MDSEKVVRTRERNRYTHTHPPPPTHTHTYTEVIIQLEAHEAEEMGCRRDEKANMRL